MLLYLGELTLTYTFLFFHYKSTYNDSQGFLHQTTFDI